MTIVGRDEEIAFFAGAVLTGAALGSINPRSILERTVLADPCSPDTASTGRGRHAVTPPAATQRLKRSRCGSQH